MEAVAWTLRPQTAHCLFRPKGKAGAGPGPAGPVLSLRLTPTKAEGSRAVSPALFTVRSARVRAPRRRSHWASQHSSLMAAASFSASISEAKSALAPMVAYGSSADPTATFTGGFRVLSSCQ